MIHGFENAVVTKAASDRLERDLDYALELPKWALSTWSAARWRRLKLPGFQSSPRDDILLTWLTRRSNAGLNSA